MAWHSSKLVIGHLTPGVNVQKTNSVNLLCIGDANLKN